MSLHKGTRETKTTIRVFKCTINPGHGKEDLEKKGNNKSEHVINFKPHQLILVEWK